MYIYIFTYSVFTNDFPSNDTVHPSVGSKDRASDSGLRSTGTALCPVASGAPGPRRAPAPWAGAKVEKST